MLKKNTAWHKIDFPIKIVETSHIIFAHFLPHRLSNCSVIDLIMFKRKLVKRIFYWYWGTISENKGFHFFKKLWWKKWILATGCTYLFIIHLFFYLTISKQHSYSCYSLKYVIRALMTWKICSRLQWLAIFLYDCFTRVSL